MSRSLCFGAFAIFVNFIPFCSKNGNFMQKMKNEWRRTYEMEKMKQTTTTNKKKKCPFSTIQTCWIQCSYHTNHIILYTKKKGNAKHMYPHESICIHITHVVGLFSSWAHSNHLAAEAAAVGEIPHCALHSKVRTNFAHTHMPYECHTICLYFIIDPLRGYQMYKLQTYKPKPYKDAA